MGDEGDPVVVDSPKLRGLMDLVDTECCVLGESCSIKFIVVTWFTWGGASCPPLQAPIPLRGACRSFSCAAS
eukprot:scaffold1124_cov37-Tisochrysis_lutea.AAC.2